MTRARSLDQEGQLVASQNLADAALAVDRDYAGALNLRISLLRQLGRREKNCNARSWIAYARRQSEQRLQLNAKE
ncbi:MAG: hypothetical protein ACR2QV_17090 [Gammaproteobacteria bacterium]